MRGLIIVMPFTPLLVAAVISFGKYLIQRHDEQKKDE